MDGTRFDQLIKQLGTTRITRLTALRGLAVGAVAATLGFAAPDDADAKKRCGECQKKKKHKSKNGKKRIRCKQKANGTLCSIGTCQGGTCTRASVAICTNNSQCAPRICVNGQCVNCTSSTQCDAPNNVCNTATGTCVAPAGITCTPNTQTGCTGGQVCNAAGNACVDCTSYTQCGTITGGGARACLSGRCRGGEACSNSAQCIPPLVCIEPVASGNQQDLCLLDDDCDENSDCPTGDPICVAGDCTRACVLGGNPCPGSRTCQGGVCL